MEKHKRKKRMKIKRRLFIVFFPFFRPSADNEASSALQQIALHSVELGGRTQTGINNQASPNDVSVAAVKTRRGNVQNPSANHQTGGN